MKYESREDLIAASIFVSLGLAIPALVVVRHFFGLAPMMILDHFPGRGIAGGVFATLAGIVSLFNFYLHQVVPWMYRREHGTTEGFGSMSGLPIIGSLFILLAAILLPASVAAGIVLFVFYVLDMLGLFWVTIYAIRGEL